MRSSCEASATKRRRRASDDVRSRKAASIWLSMPLRAEPSRPTSLRSSARRIRRVRSPPAMAPAVSVMSSSGRRPRRTIHSTSSEQGQRRTTIDTITSTWVSDARVLSVGSSEMAVTRVPPGHATACTRYCSAGEPTAGHVERRALGRRRGRGWRPKTCGGGDVLHGQHRGQHGGGVGARGQARGHAGRRPCPSSTRTST